MYRRTPTRGTSEKNDRVQNFEKNDRVQNFEKKRQSPLLVGWAGSGSRYWTASAAHVAAKPWKKKPVKSI